VQPELRVRAEDLAHCRRLLQKGSKSFSFAARLLPRDARDAATVIYAFCRIADDAVDEAPSVEQARNALAALTARVARIYDGTPIEDPIDRALAVVVRTHAVPRHALDGLLEGFLWDVDGKSYQTLEDVHAYAARVAGTVGAMIAAVVRAPDLCARACDLGIAMQLTNIARDVGEDARRGRIYLPLQWLRAAGVDPDELLRSPAPSAALAVVVQRLLDEAERIYARADPGIEALPKSVRGAIRVARLVYAEIGRVIAAHGYDAVTRRAVVPLSRKLVLAIGSWFRRAPSEDPRALPALPAARFLLPPVSP
jgi:15-cis-phytoene synthase